jgi:uncharacterized protein (DUF2249 family)
MITINANTRIAELLRGHPAALETIIGISPRFAKLRNPILRKLMAGRTSIATASKMGGCTVNDFFRSLSRLGFVVEERLVLPEGEEDGRDQLEGEEDGRDQLEGEEVGRDCQVGLEESAGEAAAIPDFMRIAAAGQVVTLDVRPVIEGGKDPLGLILSKIRTLPPGFVLRIVNSFEPSPLIILLGNKGFRSWSEQIEDDLVYTYFFQQASVVPEMTTTEASEPHEWDEILQRFTGNLTTIDVRHLEMPMPMLTILKALNEVVAGEALFVHHKRIPVFLLPELAEKGFEYRIREIGEGDVKLLIFKI